VTRRWKDRVFAEGDYETHMGRPLDSAWSSKVNGSTPLVVTETDLNVERLSHSPTPPAIRSQSGSSWSPEER